MRIAINGQSILFNERTGIGRYTFHLLDSLGKIDRVHEYLLYVPPQRLFDFKRRLPDFSRYPNFKNRMDFWQQGMVKSDVYHMPSPDAISPHAGRLVVTIHDLIYKTYPEGHHPQTIATTEKHMQAIASTAERIICVSENTRRDLHSFWNIPLAKTCVVYNGVDHAMFYPLSAPQRQEAAVELTRWGIEGPFILYVGTIEPRKNLAGLLESFAMLRSRKAFEGHLVVAGMKGWRAEDIEARIKNLGLQSKVVFTGFVDNRQLCCLYNMAEVFVFPSFYEGFGFPILESFCCGTPVITSNTSACTEIAGQAALLIDPRDLSALAQALERALTDKALRESLRQAGFKRSKDFSFALTAQKTLKIYEELDR